MFANIHFDIIIIESELTFINKYIFVIAGKAQTGKDATAKLIRKYGEKYNLKTAIIQYSMYVKLYARALTGWDFEEETKPRTLLQNIGQDVRSMVSQRFFINRIIDDIRILANYVDIIVISDARLPEELDDIKKEDKVYLLVAHNGISRAIESYVRDMSNEEFAGFGIKNCELRKYEF